MLRHRRRDLEHLHSSLRRTNRPPRHSLRRRHLVRLHATSWAKAYIFEVRTFQIFAIYTGYYLIDLILMGAIVGAWKKKPELPAG